MHQLILANFAMHISLTEAEQQQVLDHLEFREIKKNEVLLQAGSISRNYYFVNRGCVRLYHQDENGYEHNLMLCPENWWAAEIASFTRQEPAFYSIAALEDTQVFSLSFTQLQTAYREVPKLERFFRILTENGFGLFQRLLTSSQSVPAEERYDRFRKLYPGLEQRIAQKQIASYLGITPVFLSMIRKKKSHG